MIDTEQNKKKLNSIKVLLFKKWSWKKCVKIL